MKNKTLSLAFLIFTLNIYGCNRYSGVTPTQVETLVPGEPGYNLLIVAEGEIQLKRDSWHDFYPTAFGTVLQRGDQLRPGTDTKAVVLCDDLTLWTALPGSPSGLTNGCPFQPDPPLVRGESQIGNTRGPNDALIPYIINPRATRLLSLTPTLRWNAVPGANSYTVNLRGGDINWSTETTETEIAYPGEPVLEPDEWYLLIVVADSGKSSQEEGQAGLGFSPLLSSDSEGVQAAADKLAKLDLPVDAVAYAMAQLYAGNGLLSEAIEILESLAATDNPHHSVHLTLGDIYNQIGLTVQAEKHYLIAIDKAEISNDLEGLSMAQEGLGAVYFELAIIDEAVLWLEQARNGFKELGDAGRLIEIDKQLDLLR